MTDPYLPPENRDNEPPLFTPVHALLWMLSSFLVMVMGALTYYLIQPNAGSDLVGLGLVSAACFLVMSALLIGRHPGGSKLSEPLGVRASHPLAALVGLLVGLCAKVPAEQLSLWIEKLSPRSADDSARLQAMFEPESALHAVSLLLVIAVLVPLSEEVFFRGAVYGALRRGRTPELPATVVTALGFAFCHADIRQMLPILFVAFVLGALRSLSGSLLPSIAAHMAFNAVAIIGATYKLLPEVDELSVGLRAGATAGLCLLLILLWGVVGRHPRARAARVAETTLVLDAGEATHG